MFDLTWSREHCSNMTWMCKVDQCLCSDGQSAVCPSTTRCKQWYAGLHSHSTPSPSHSFTQVWTRCHHWHIKTHSHKHTHCFHLRWQPFVVSFSSRWQLKVWQRHRKKKTQKSLQSRAEKWWLINSHYLPHTHTHTHTSLQHFESTFNGSFICQCVFTFVLMSFWEPVMWIQG